MRSASTPTRSPSNRPSRTPAGTGSPGGSARGPAAFRAGNRPIDVVLANLIAGVLVPLAGALRDELRPGGTLVASGIFIDREAEVRSAFEAGGLRVGGRAAEGDWVALDRGQTGLTGSPGAPTLQSRSMPATLFPIILVAHIGLAISLFLPSILLPFTLRTRRATVESESGFVRALLWAQSHGTVVIGVGLALTGLALVSIIGTQLFAQPWLLIALVIYFVNLAIAFFIQRPNLRRLVASRPRPTTPSGRRGPGVSATCRT